MNDKPTLAQSIEYRLALLEADRPELDPDTYRMRRKLILLGFGNPVSRYTWIEDLVTPRSK